MSHENATEIVNNSIAPFKKMTKVISRKKKYRLSIIGLILASLCFFLLYGSDDRPPRQRTFHINRDFESSLKRNLSHLIRSNKPALPARTRHNMMSLNKLTKKEIARERAPMNMFSLPPNNDVYSGYEPFDHSLISRKNGSVVNNKLDQSQSRVSVMPYPRETIAAGEMIHAVLESAINSAVPGPVRAIVSRPVYSYSGNHLMIPRGSRLIGKYASALNDSQSRIYIIWNTLILPSGTLVNLNSATTDSLGRSGQAADNVNHHFFSRFGSSVLLSILGAATALPDNSSITSSSPRATYMSSISQSFQQSSSDSLERNLSARPTMSSYQGAKINIFAAHNLCFHHDGVDT